MQIIADLKKFAKQNFLKRRLNYKKIERDKSKQS